MSDPAVGKYVTERERAEQTLRTCLDVSGAIRAEKPRGAVRGII